MTGTVTGQSLKQYAAAKRVFVANSSVFLILTARVVNQARSQHQHFKELRRSLISNGSKSFGCCHLNTTSPVVTVICIFQVSQL